jgi:hypothetical protein
LAAVAFAVVAACGGTSATSDQAAPPTAAGLAVKAGARSFNPVNPPPLLVLEAVDGVDPTMFVHVYASNGERDSWVAVARSTGVTMPVVAGDLWTIQTDRSHVRDVIARVGGRVVLE